MGTPRKKKKVGVEFEVHLGKKMEGQWKVAERILGRWRIAGTEPYKVCEGDEDLMGNRNLRLADSGPCHMWSEAPGSTPRTPEKDVMDAE